MPGQCLLQGPMQFSKGNAVFLMNRILRVLLLFLPVCVPAADDRKARSARGIVEQLQSAEPVWLQLPDRSLAGSRTLRS